MNVRVFHPWVSPARFVPALTILCAASMLQVAVAAQDGASTRGPDAALQAPSDDWHVRGVKSRSTVSANPGTILASACIGGSRPGGACSGDADCPGKCAGGKVPGEACFGNGGLNCQGACTGMPTHRCSNSDDCAIFVGSKCSSPAPGTCTAPAPGTCHCDDGNPCTDDVDDPDHGCVFTPNALSCDDGNTCTHDDVCQGGSCTGTAQNCPDNDPCTADYCDPVTGCRNTPVPLVDVEGVHFTSPTSMTWPYLFPVSSYDTYRGTIPAATLGSRLPAMVYDQACFERDDEHADGLTVTVDTSLPAAASAFYYFVSIAQRDCGEGPLGADSSGAPVPNASPCPP